MLNQNFVNKAIHLGVLNNTVLNLMIQVAETSNIGTEVRKVTTFVKLCVENEWLNTYQDNYGRYISIIRDNHKGNITMFKFYIELNELRESSTNAFVSNSINYTDIAKYLNIKSGGMFKTQIYLDWNESWLVFQQVLSSILDLSIQRNFPTFLVYNITLDLLEEQMEENLEEINELDVEIEHEHENNN